MVVDGLQAKGCSRGAGASSQCFWRLSKSADWLVSVGARESRASVKAKSFLVVGSAVNYLRVPKSEES